MIPVMHVALLIIAFLTAITPASAQKKKDNTPLVNLFIGTEGEGHTSPGPASPYGMIQLSPVTRLTGPAYQFTDTVVYGFSHVRAIMSDSTEENSLIFMPTTGEPNLNTNVNWSPCEKKEEEASPGYYKTLLTKYDIEVALTATLRAALHQYDFPKTDKANIIIDLQHGGEVDNAWVEVVNKSELRGYRLSKNRHLYFYAKFSKPFKMFGVAAGNVLQQNKVRTEGKDIKMFVQFDDPGEVMVKVGLSHVSEAGALKSLDSEIPAFDFKGIQKAAKTAWINELAKIQVEGGGPSRSAQNIPPSSVSGANAPKRKALPAPDYGLIKRTAFYTALYHTMLTPAVGSDVDGQYRGTDGKIATATGFTYYDVKGVHQMNLPWYQLLTLTDHKRTLDIIKSRIVSPAANERKDIFSPLMAAAFAKGIKDAGTEKATGIIPGKPKYAPMRLSELQLDSLFNDASHGDHYNHLPYMYSFTKAPYKMQIALTNLLKRYTMEPTGLPGNDNQGQLSAWYVLSSLGIYNIVPGSQQYIIGLPQFEKAVITLPKDKKFSILNSGVGITPGNIYLQGFNLNKQGYTKLFINYDDIAKGGELEVFTGTMANKLFMQDLEKPLITE